MTAPTLRDVGTKVAEIRQGAHLPSCDDVGSCSMHRRHDRVYEDDIWRLALTLGPGHHVHDPRCS